MQFEWDDEKATRNLRKHGVESAAASTAFGDPLSLTISDPHSVAAEDRFLLVGQMAVGGLVVVAFTERGGSLRIMSE